MKKMPRNIFAFVKVKNHSTREEGVLERIIINSGGQILVEYGYPLKVLVINISHSKLLYIKEHDYVLRLYTEKIPHSTVRGYTNIMQYAAKVFHDYLDS